jgi:crotonobetainyl-CoA:carnitine CoA-transferase CaiB-like acyl-CoA transferase
VHPERGEMRVQGLPVALSRTPGAIRLPAPAHGQHTDEVLAELGYSPGDIARFRADRVV